jgi:quercetin dioxygenase-like cupin family protein
MMKTDMSTNPLWFQNSLVTVRVSTSDGQDGLSILEHLVPFGFSPPLHIHRTEDEVFHVLEGQFRVRVQDQEHRLGAGDVLLAPKGVPHTYRVESAPEGRCLTITAEGDFERFVRAVSRPAERPELPPPAGPPSADAIRALKAAATQHGIELVGPPLQ